MAAQGRQVTSIQEGAIRYFALQSYSSSDPSLPSGLCTTCQIRLSWLVKWRGGSDRDKPPTRKLDVATTYENPLTITTRSNPVCSCRICSYVRMNSLKRTGFMDKTKSPPSVLKICSHCKQELYPGCPHSEQMCKSKISKIRNITNIVGEDMDRVTANVVRDKVSNSGGADTIYLDNQVSGKAIQLRVNRPSPKPRLQLNMGDIQELRGFGMSDRQVLGTVEVLKRRDTKVVESNLKQKVVAEKRMLDRFFDKKIVDVVQESTKKSGEPNKIVLVFCSNIVGLRDCVADGS